MFQRGTIAGFIVMSWLGVASVTDAALKVVSYTYLSLLGSGEPLQTSTYTWSKLSYLQREFADQGPFSPVSSITEPRVVGPALFYPNPFKLSYGSTLGYRLNRHLDIVIRIYDMRGYEFFRRSYTAGAPGGRGGFGSFGYNRLSFTRAELGELPSAVYFFVLIHHGKVLAKGKFLVLPG